MYDGHVLTESCWLVHAKEKKIIRSCQHGFTTGKSCSTNLIAFCDGMAGCVDEERAVDVAYLDFCQAFGLVSHNIFAGMTGNVGCKDSEVYRQVAVLRGS